MIDFLPLAVELGKVLQARKWMLALAESCTGGWIAEAVTAVPGSSEWFERGFVTYSNEAKQEMLGVQSASLLEQGAVSEVVAKEMALGALAHSRAQVSLAVTGVAGPSGGSSGKPVGTVWIAWAREGVAVQTKLYSFKGDRAAIRSQSVESALRGLIDFLR
jgi:nicotinamide-nucleotide amidase